MLDAFRQAFQNGGLDEVDNLIDSINAAIRLAGGSKGLGDGAALQHADGSDPAYLHIVFVDFVTEEILAREWISLGPSLPPSVRRGA